MYSLNNGRDAGSEYRIINRSGIAFYFVFIYRSNPTFPLFKNRFSDNLRLFKRQIVPIRIRNRFDFSTGSLSLSLFIRTRLEEHLSWTIRPQRARHNARRILSLGCSLVYFSPSVFPRTVTHFRHWTPNSKTEPVFRARNGTRVVSPCTWSYTLPSFVLCSPLPPPLLGLVSPMYANPVYELAKCTRKCIRRTINCRSSLEEVLRKLWQVGRNWVNLGSEFYQYRDAK